MFSTYQSEDKNLSPIYINKNNYEGQTDRLLYENHYRLITNLHNFCWNLENYTHLYRRCSKTFTNQTKPKEHMLKCIEQEVCNISYMHLKRKVKIFDWYMKTVPPIWIAAQFECMNVPL